MSRRKSRHSRAGDAARSATQPSPAVSEKPNRRDDTQPTPIRGKQPTARVVSPQPRRWLLVLALAAQGGWIVFLAVVAAMG